MPYLTLIQRQEAESLYNQGKKRCTKCREIKSLSEFSPDKAGWKGLRSKCRKCVRNYHKQWEERNPNWKGGINAYLRKWRANNRERSNDYSRKWREKNPGYFSAIGKKKRQDPIERAKLDEMHRRYYESNKEACRERHRKYRSENQEKIKESNHKYRAEHRDERKAYNQRYFEEHKTERRTYSRQWRANNLEKAQAYEHEWYAKNHQRILEQRHKNYHKNPILPRARTAKHRTMKAMAGGSFTPEEWQALCDKYDNCCLCCGEKKPLEADHVIPVSKGGSSNIENLQPLCRSCNASKCDKTIDYRPDH